MINLKMNKYFFSLIVSGKKKLEFRKLSKGLCHGKYMVIDNESYDYLGDIELKPVAVNPAIDNELVYNTHEVWIKTGEISGHVIGHIDKGSYTFIRKNYIDKKEDFVAYEIKLLNVIEDTNKPFTALRTGLTDCEPLTTKKGGEEC